MNNWQSKKIKMVGTIGLILQHRPFVDYAVEATKTYVAQSLFADGTSHDLKQQDALSYHNAGLRPLLVFDVQLRQFKNYKAVQLYTYQSPAGASLKKSVDYVKPFATGQQKRQGWVNTKVALDKKRAAAGLTEYQPG